MIAFDYTRTEPSQDTYFHDIDTLGMSMLTLQQELDLAKRIEAGDEQAREQLIHANLKLVISIAKRYTTNHLTQQDLIQEGNIGLVEAVSRYDWRRGLRFATYATYWIRQYISRAIGDKEKMIRLPIHMEEAIRAIRKFRPLLHVQLGREPNDKELADVCNCTVGDIQRAKQGSTFRVISIDATLDPRINDGDSSALADLLMEMEDPYSPIETMEQETIDAFEAALHQFSRRTQDILRKRIGFDQEGQTLSQIAKKWNISRERVRQIESDNLPKLQQLMQQWREEMCA